MEQEPWGAQAHVGIDQLYLLHDLFVKIHISLLCPSLSINRPTPTEWRKWNFWLRLHRLLSLADFFKSFGGHGRVHLGNFALRHFIWANPKRNHLHEIVLPNPPCPRTKIPWLLVLLGNIIIIQFVLIESKWFTRTQVITIKHHGVCALRKWSYVSKVVSHGFRFASPLFDRHMYIYHIYIYISIHIRQGNKFLSPEIINIGNRKNHNLVWWFSQKMGKTNGGNLRQTKKFGPQTHIAWAKLI